MKDNKFEIDNPLLIQAIRGSFYCEKGSLQNCSGYLNNDDFQIGRAFLEYCISEVLGIHRYPGYELWYAKSSRCCSHIREIGLINDLDIKKAVKQVEELYNYTQNILRENNIKHVNLYRSLRPFEIEFLKQQVKDGNAELKLATNIITSYSRTHELGYGSKVGLHREVQAEDILLIDTETKCGEDSVMCNNSVFCTETEIWVINRDKCGEIIIQYDDIDNPYEELQKPMSRYFKNTNHTIEDVYDGSFMKGACLSIKPCQMNDIITKWVINRNIKKIKKLSEL